MSGIDDLLFLVEKRITDSNSGIITDIQQKIPMGYIEKKIREWILPEIEKINETIESQSRKIQELEHSNKQLNDLLKEEKEKNEKIKNKLDQLSSNVNSEELRLKRNYSQGVTEFQKLNRKMTDYIRKFDEVGCSSLLEMITEYFYIHSQELKDIILAEFEKTKTTLPVMNLLEEIDNFDKTYRPNIDRFLGLINSSLEKCLIFPKERYFLARDMESVTGRNLKDGSPVYIIGLGYDFPEIDVPSQKPSVFPKEADIVKNDN